METENDGKTDKTTAAPARVIVEGEPADAENAAIPARTPRDVAIQKTRAGEDVAFEASAPIKDEPPLRVSPRSSAAGVFVDANGREWKRSGRDESRATTLDPNAILKDGGDPGVLNIPPHRVGEKYLVDNPGNAQYSPNGILNTDTGEVREKTPEEGGIDAGDINKPEVAESAVKLTAGGRTKRKSATKTTKGKSGRGGSGAKARSQAKARGGAKAKK